ncbi:MAG TPA: M15 family metallopeptidase [Steroidobacteraceae bacterium]
MTPAELTGRARTHIVDVADPSGALHVHAVAAFMQLRRAAAADGFDLVPVSAFRDFARQLAIWNRKWSGEVPLNDPAGNVLDSARLSEAERVDAILYWSALPGASRHHWGTDLDLIDRRALAPGYRVQLVAAEYAPLGPFARLAEWLEANASRFGFFRPFRGVLSGVQAEPWHFSFAPVAEPARRGLTAGLLREALERSDLAGKEAVLPRVEEIHARYVASIDWP